MEVLGTIFWILFLGFTVFALYMSFQRVPEANVRLVERLGKYTRTLKPGINLIIPFIETIKIADITTYDKDPSSPDGARADMRYIVSSKGFCSAKWSKNAPRAQKARSKNSHR